MSLWNRWKQLSILVLKGYPLMRSSLFNLRVSFGRRSGSELRMSHPGCAGGYHLAGSMAGDGGAWTRARREPGILLTSVAVITPRGAGAGPRVLEQSPEVGSRMAPFLVSVCIFFDNHSSILVESSTRGRGARVSAQESVLASIWSFFSLIMSLDLVSG